MEIGGKGNNEDELGVLAKIYEMQGCFYPAAKALSVGITLICDCFQDVLAKNYEQSRFLTLGPEALASAEITDLLLLLGSLRQIGYGLMTKQQRL